MDEELSVVHGPVDDTHIPIDMLHPVMVGNPAPPPPMSPFNVPRQRQVFLILVMRNTQPHLHVDSVSTIMNQILSFFQLYEEGGAYHGYYCAYHLSFELGEFVFE